MTWAELAAAAEAVVAAIPAAPHELPIAGIGWATVDEERARGELDGLLAADQAAPALASWVALERDGDLGARRWIRAAPAGALGVPALVLLEPDTEGRLAASLARFGEGVAAVYLGAAPPGRSHLVSAAGRWGPYAIVVDHSR
jgi:hypothetical protein